MAEVTEYVTDAVFGARTRAALMWAVNVVVTEEVTTPNHANRFAWAHATLRTAQSIRDTTQRAILGILGDQRIRDAAEADKSASEIPQSTYDDAVLAIVDVLAAPTRAVADGAGTGA